MPSMNVINCLKLDPLYLQFKVEVLTDTGNQSPGGRQQRKATKKINYSLMMAGEDEDEEGDVEEWAEAVAEAGEKEKWVGARGGWS